MSFSPMNKLLDVLFSRNFSVLLKGRRPATLLHSLNLVYFLKCWICIKSCIPSHLQMIREVLLVAHRQAFAWVDEWHGMTIEDVRTYEQTMQQETNQRLRADMSLTRSVSVDQAASDRAERDELDGLQNTGDQMTTPTAKKGWFW
jgi:hypothetical protein